MNGRVNGKLPEPSDLQWEAIRACDEHLLVAAGAGTGKTFTVVNKLLYLMGVEIRGECHARPIRLRDVAAITYTTKAAAELKDKLRRALRTVGRRTDAYEVDGSRVGTIHSFCGDVLREFALRTGRPPSLSPVDDAEGRVLAYEAVRESLLGALDDGSVDGLHELLAERSVKDVEGWMGELLEQGDHLRHLSSRAMGFGRHERVLVGLAERARDALEARLIERGEMDFDRMIVWTRDLIRDDAVVRKALQRRIKVLVVDEFQDVDPVQREIAYLLGEPASRRHDTTRLVFVGDPKQSIYRFRRADVTVWRSVEEDFSEQGCGRIVSLSESRRSVPAVLGLVDQVVGALLDTPIDVATGRQAFEVEYAPITSARPDAPAYAGVEFICVPADGEKAHKLDVCRTSEARAVAARARALHDEHGVPWSKMALLLSSWGSLSIYEGALRSANIPVYALRTEGFYARREVLDLLVGLRVVRAPTDLRALVGFLRSPWVGLADESLLDLVRQCEGACWPRRAELTLSDAGEQERWTRGVTLLERWCALRDRVPVAELLEEMLESGGYAAHVQLIGDQCVNQRLANVRKLVRMAASAPELGVGAFLELVDRARELGVREGDARLYGEQDDVVTITSVHSAKGLEWGVVFWCDLGRGENDTRGALVIGRERVMLGEADTPAKERREEWQQVAAALRNEARAETSRLWYVAATRAADLLVLSGIPLGKASYSAGSPALALRAALPALEESASTVRFSSRHGLAFTGLVNLCEVAIDEHDAMRAELPVIGDPAAIVGPRAALATAIGRSRHSATQLMAYERCGRRHWFKYIIGLKEPRPETTGHDASGEGRHHGLTPVEHGLVVHDVLERWEAEGALSELIEEALERRVPDSPPISAASGRQLRRELAAELDAALAQPAMRALLEQSRSRRELPFTFIEEGGFVIEGAIDLVASSDAGYDVIDVKTSDCTAEVAAMKAESYALQRASYVAAIEGVSGRPVRSFTFQFTRAAVAVGGTVPAASGLRLASIANTMSNDVPAMGAAHECRTCGYRSAGWCPGTPVEGLQQG